jgi:hypothetical protein
MANSIALVTAFRAILDAVYKRESLTAAMDPQIQTVGFEGTNIVKVMKISAVGLGNYSRATGFPVGDVTAAWEAMALACERGRAFTIDRMDNDETLGLAFGKLASEFYRTKVAPEIDAYRFSKYASWSGINEVATPATLDKTTILAAIDVAKATLRAAEVPPEECTLYVSDSVGGFIEGAVTRTVMNGQGMDRRVPTLDGIPIVIVPQTRFYKGITLDAGATSSAGGYTKTATTGRDINFMLIHPMAVIQPIKFEITKVFDPDTNQQTDGWLVQTRLYHDAFVEDNKVIGIYSHIKGS